jgi:hypothetical protein
MTELDSNYCAGQQSEGSCRSKSLYSRVSKPRNRFLLSFGLLILVWIKTESCARPLPQNSTVCQFLDARREKGRAWEREGVSGESEGELGKEGEKLLSLQGN